MPRSDERRKVPADRLPTQAVASSVDHVATRLEALEQLGGLSKRAELTISRQIPASLASDLIRRLFAAGLHLASLQSLLGDGALSGKAGAAVEELDSLIRDIRTAAVEQT